MSNVTNVGDGIVLGQEDGQVDGDISCDGNDMPGGFEPGGLPYQYVPDESGMISQWASSQSEKQRPFRTLRSQRMDGPALRQVSLTVLS